MALLKTFCSGPSDGAEYWKCCVCSLVAESNEQVAAMRPGACVLYQEE